jgi:hypothetical protein
LHSQGTEYCLFHKCEAIQERGEQKKGTRTTGRRTTEKEKNIISVWEKKRDSKLFGIVEKLCFGNRVI